MRLRLHARSFDSIAPIRPFSTRNLHTPTLSLDIPKDAPIYVMMSGGVDSTVAARFLSEKGHRIHPVYMRNWDPLDEMDQICEWKKEWSAVQDICATHLAQQEPPLLMDLSREYYTQVFEPALDEYQRGTTPNPDVVCNRVIKFGDFFPRLRTRIKNTGDPLYVATGHYARLHHTQDEVHLHQAIDPRMDQSYFLSTTRPESLRNVVFPLGTMTKTDTRALAQRYGISDISSKPASRGLCFVGPRRNFGDFLASYMGPQASGDVVDINTGKVISTHSGLFRYTLGQGARIPKQKIRYRVLDKDIQTDILYVAPFDSDAFFKTGIMASDVHFIGSHPLQSGHASRVSIRTSAWEPGYPGTASLHNGHLYLSFDKPKENLALGQTAAIYDSTRCIAGSVIRSFL